MRPHLHTTRRMAAATDFGLACVIAGRHDDAAEVFKQWANRSTSDSDSEPGARGTTAAEVIGHEVVGQGGDDGTDDDALSLFTGILEASLRAYGNNSFRTLSTAGNLGIMFMHAEMHDEAAALFEWTTSTMKKVLGPEHPHTLRAAVNWGEPFSCHVSGSCLCVCVYRIELG